MSPILKTRRWHGRIVEDAVNVSDVLYRLFDTIKRMESVTAR